MSYVGVLFQYIDNWVPFGQFLLKSPLESSWGSDKKLSKKKKN